MQDRTVGQILRAWRGDSSPEQAAVAAGVSRNTLHSWESDSTEPKWSQVMALEKWRPGLVAALLGGVALEDSAGGGPEAA